MRISLISALLLSLTAEAVAWGDVQKAVYNKWHKTELERWLDDHSVKYPKAADRKELQNLVQKNWDTYSSPSTYFSWPDNRLSEFIQAKTGKPAAPADRNGLVHQIQVLWDEGWARLPGDKWGEAKTWIFDTWSDSQLRNFLQHHGVVDPPEVGAREKLVNAVRKQYDVIAHSINGKEKEPTSSYYPGDWLYDSWSDSELRNWLVARGWVEDKTAPTTRDKLLVAIRNNWLSSRVINDVKAFEKSASSAASGVSRSISSASKAAEASASSGSKVASQSAKAAHARATAEASSLSAAAKESSKSLAAEASKSSVAAVKSLSSVEARILDSWSDSQLKVWADEHGVPVPQGIRRNELLSLVRRHRAKLASDATAAASSVSASAASVAGAATTKAGNAGSQATDAPSGLLWEATEKIRGALGLGSQKAHRAGEEVKGNAKLASAKAKASASSASLKHEL